MLALHVGGDHDIAEFGGSLEASNLCASLGEIFATIGCYRLLPCRRADYPIGAYLAQQRDAAGPLEPGEEIIDGASDGLPLTTSCATARWSSGARSLKFPVQG